MAKRHKKKLKIKNFLIVIIVIVLLIIIIPGKEEKIELKTNYDDMTLDEIKAYADTNKLEVKEIEVFNLSK